MNWKLLLLLSLFGIPMGLLTTWFVSTRAEAFCWLPVFACCAWLIGKYARRRYFLHGFLTNIACSVWVTIIHIKLEKAYLASHPLEAAQFPKYVEAGMSVAVAIGLTSTMIGLFSGVILGAFAAIAARLLGKVG